MNPLTISPPFLNSSNPWCTSLEQLQELYDCVHTGAVTTRTSLLNGFPHDPTIHQFAFFNPKTLSASPTNTDKAGTPDQNGSLNTLGYSPIPLKDYLSYIQTISTNLPDGAAQYKPFIISVTGSENDVIECYKLITAHQRRVRMPLAMEVNLSCPNIPGKPPPAYSSASLLSYLSALKQEIARQVAPANLEYHSQGLAHVPIGIKTPPYTYHDQFQSLLDALLASAEADPTHLPCPVSFITATNTLGSSLLLEPKGGSADETFERTVNSANATGVGGLAGAPLHPLALGNVLTIKGLLLEQEKLQGIQIIGVGGVEDKEGFRRMRAVGAAAVGVGTALGRKGIDVFRKIGEGET